jgi:hypothetical protein
VGSFAGQAAVSGQQNAYVGYKAGWLSTSGVRNTYLGGSAAPQATTGSDNTVVGYSAAPGLTSGSSNVVIGGMADVGSPGASQTTAIGSGAKANADNCVALGAGAHCDVVSAIVLGNPDAGSHPQAAIGTGAPARGAILELRATDKGFLPPRLTNAEMAAMPPETLIEGLIVYASERHQLCFFNGKAWRCFP